MTTATTTRLCARDGCDEPITRKTGESAEQTARRAYCTRACYRAAVEVENPTRTCQHAPCGRTFGPSTYERASSFVKRAPKYCSQACNGAAKSAAAVPPERTYARPGCGAVLVRRPRERVAALRRRRFCGPPCAAGARKRDGTRAQRQRARRAATPAAPRPQRPARPKPAPSVFGDVAPAAPWRPAGFSARPGGG